MRRAIATMLFALALATLAAGGARAGWDEARAALQAGKTGAAFRELKPMAEEGDKEAQYMIAYLLSTGNGVKQDFEEAYMWYSIAVARGHTTANTARSFVRKKLNFAAAAEAERKARIWLQEYHAKEAQEEAKAKVEERRQKLEDKQAEEGG